MDWRDRKELWETSITSDREDVSIRFRFAPIRGRLECVGVEVTRSRNPITTSFLRGIKWSGLIEEKKRINLKRAHEWARRKGSPTSILPTQVDLIEEAERMIPKWEASLGQKRGRRPEHGPDHFARVAQVYIDAFEGGLPPTRAVAERWNVTRSAAAKWVARARKDGLLPPTKKRVAKARIPRKGKKR